MKEKEKQLLMSQKSSDLIQLRKKTINNKTNKAEKNK